jgi:Domain of unknown function (DUF4380)
MRGFACACGLVALLLLAGCGQDVDRARPDTTPPPPNPRLSLATESVEVTQVQYHGWSGLRMSNGLVVLIAVPEIGGRVMEYKLSGHPFIWSNPAEYGRTYPAPTTESERTWHNFGGYKVWPAPQSEWKGPPDPVGSQLDGGKWTGEIVQASGQAGEIKLVSPADPSATGLQITRSVKLFAGSTRVEVRETFSNVSDHDIRWSVWDVTQVPGAVKEGSAGDPESRVYFPLNPQSKLPGAYVKLIDDPAGDAQWQVQKDQGLMRVSYGRKTGKIGADSVAGWIAHVDEVHNRAYIKRFEVEKLADYPDRGCTVEVYTSGDLPYMEVEVLSPVYPLPPGQSRTVTRQWLATSTPGAVRDVGDVGVVTRALDCKAEKDQLRVTAGLGVFGEGAAVLAAADESGKVTGEIAKFPASPAAPLTIDELVPRPKTALLVLELRNANGTPLGRLGSVPVPAVPKEQVAEANP